MAGKGGNVGADAFFKGLLAQIAAHVPGSDAHSGRSLIQVQAQIGAAGVDERADVAFLQLIGRDGLQCGLSQLFGCVGQVAKAQDLRRLNEAIHVFLEPKDRGAIDGVIAADTFKKAGAVM
ncbi:hypothetical protein SDC9_189502 [bioreactor metagenome]|uniref:Uncharacterized protein n=1 Tax=bioreactor metagenome TaxID=1076179 RepID=A0A645HSM5_9ZZZZ